MHHRRSAHTTLRHVLCAAFATASIVTSTPGYAAPGVTSPGTSFAPGCDGQRWVGVKTTSTCPTVAGWNGSLVFPPPSAGSGTPPGLEDYCLYTWGGTPTAPGTVDIAALQGALGAAGVLGLSEDCVVVGPLGPEEKVNSEVRPRLRDALFQAAGGLDELPPADGDLARIRVAVADTSPTATDIPIPLGNSHHGYSMGWIAQGLACPGGPGDPSCHVDVTTQLALPRVTNETTDHILGGYFGTPVELAKAINGAVNAWKRQRSARQERLVLNLSLGWQPGIDSCPAYGVPSTPEVPSSGLVDDETVFAALLHAACHGVLVIAAAGNDPGGASFDPGPTCPAAWQSISIPTETECVSLFKDASDPDDPPGGLPLLPPEDMDLPETPLVYGVGGVDYTGSPLSTTRLGSLGRHAAIAFQGVAGDPTQPLPAPLTGSSTSAAIVSGAAAALWAYRPELTGHEIMALLHETGSPVDVAPEDLDNPEIEGPLHRVSLCRALSTLLCPAPEPDCALPLDACSEPVASPFQSPALIDALRPSIDEFYEGADIFPSTLTADPPANELHKSFMVGPWVHPSPIQPICGGPCVLDVVNWKLMVSINPDSGLFESQALTHMTLVLENAAQVKVYIVAKAEGPNVSLLQGLKPGDMLVLDKLAVPQGFHPVRASVVFQIENGYETASVVEPILLIGGQ